MIVGTGCDLVPVERLNAACQRTPRLVERLFTAAEVQYASGSEGLIWDRLAGLFAAKEATLKALGTGMRGGAFRDIEVVHSDLGQPTLELHGTAAATAWRMGVGRWHVSISHAGGFAMATVIAEREGL